jgi:hypothetical protein
VTYHYAGFACNSRPCGIIALDRGYVEDAPAMVRERLVGRGGRASLQNQTLAAHQSKVSYKPQGARRPPTVARARLRAKLGARRWRFPSRECR